MLVNVQNYAHEDPIANSSIEIETDFLKNMAAHKAQAYSTVGTS